MTKLYIDRNNIGTVRYYKDEDLTILHRENGPAVEYSDGEKHWFLNGDRHRDGGPAIISFNGTKQWILNGKFHREDGPACEYPNGNKIWYLNGKRCSEKEHEILTKRKNLINFL